jgi:hypothetical protein
MKNIFRVIGAVVFSMSAMAGSAVKPLDALENQTAVVPQTLPLPFDYLSLVDPLLVDTPCGDRDTGVEFLIPDDALIQNGGKFLNVMNPPEGLRAAAGDGITDDTEALKDAMDYVRDVYVKDGWYGPNIYLYFPNGTYHISDTLFYRGDAVHIDMRGGKSPPRGPNTWDLATLRMIGQSREKVILQLADAAPGFGDPSVPKAVIKNYHDSVKLNNACCKTLIQNLTVDTGSKNPGAVGITLISANRCRLSNLELRSGDGAGFAGFWVHVSCILGMVQDITIDGFDYGVKFDVPQYFDMYTVGFEHMTLKNQNRAGMYFEAGSSIARKVLSQQVQPGVVAAETARAEGAQLVLIDCEFYGKDRSICAAATSHADYEHIYARNLKTRGYRAALSVGGNAAVDADVLEEYSTLPVKEKTASLVAEDFPVLRFPALSDWISPDAFGAVGDGTTDDTVAIQKALDSGSPLVYFPKNRYKFTRVRVPDSVTCIYGMGALLDGCIDVTEASPEALWVHDVYETDLTVQLHAQRNMVMDYGRCFFENCQSLPVKLHVSTMPSIDNTQSFCPSNTLVYARCLNTESPHHPNFTVNGGILWCLTFKTEHKPQPAFVVKNGGFAEILSGFISVPTSKGWQPRGIQAFVTENGGLSLIAATTQAHGFYELIASNGTLYEYDVFPKRLESSEANRFIPLFVNY